MQSLSKNLQILESCVNKIEDDLCIRPSFNLGIRQYNDHTRGNFMALTQEARSLLQDISTLIYGGGGSTQQEIEQLREYFERSRGLIPVGMLRTTVSDLLHHNFMQRNNARESRAIWRAFHSVYPGEHGILR